MRAPVTIVIGFVLIWFAYTTFRDLRVTYNAEIVDGNRVFALFSQLILIAVAAGIVFLTTFMPTIAEWVGNFFFNPNEKIEDPRDARARAALANGEYEAAIREYAKLWEKHSDPEALRQISEIRCEKMNDPQGAVRFLESALDARWTDENAALINGLLAGIAWTHQRDAERARQLLSEVIDAVPNSRQAMNAQHQLQRIEREVIAEAHAPRNEEQESSRQ